MERHNNQPSYGKKDFGSTTADSSHDDLNIHNSFPGRKAPMDNDNHPDRHTIATEHRHGTPSGPTVEKPQVTKTDKAEKKAKFPFQGKNS